MKSVLAIDMAFCAAKFLSQGNLL